MKDLKITQGTRVTLHFALLLEDGQVVDSNFEGNPAQLELGDGNLPQHFEACLHDLAAGDRRQFTLPPEKAFGQPNPSNVQQLARSAFDQVDGLEVGMVLGFADKSGGELPGRIAAIEETQVTVDFNHPLAGHTLIFDVAILDVEPVSVQ